MKEKFKNLMALLEASIAGLFACAIITMCTSCAQTKYVTVPEYHDIYIHNTDTLLQRDSIMQHDSIFVTVRGDTVYTSRYHTVYRDRLIYKNHTDTLQTTDTLTVTQQVPANITLLQKIKFGVKGVIWFAILAAIGYIIYKFRTPVINAIKYIINLIFHR